MTIYLEFVASAKRTCCTFRLKPAVVPTSRRFRVLNRPQGKGTTFVVYNDARLRIFRSDTGGVVVQTKADEVVPV